MMPTRLFPIGEDPNCPCAVTAERLRQALLSLQLTDTPVEEEGVIGFSVQDQLVMVSFSADRRFLSVRSVWPVGEAVSDEAMVSLFSATDAWNREHILPTTYVQRGEEGDVQVVADLVTNIVAGLGQEQLEKVLDIGASSTAGAIMHLRQTAL